MPKKNAAPAIPDSAEPGSAMAALSPREREYVRNRVYAGMDHKPAAAAAGYAVGEGRSAQHFGLPRRNDVQAAIAEECRKLMREQGPKSIMVLVNIRDDEAAPARDRIKASTELLNRAGLHAISETMMHVEHHLSEPEMDRRILALAADLGLSPAEAQKLLIAPADMERNADGVFELPAEPTPEPSDHAMACRASRARYSGLSPEEKEAEKQRRREEQRLRMKNERAAAEAEHAQQETEDHLIIDGEEY